MSVLDDFLLQSFQTPEAIALKEASRAVTYADLRGCAAGAAARLARAGVMPGARVAVFLDRGIDGAIAILGTLIAGACYVPLDVKNPPTRLSFIVDDAAVSAVIGRGDCPGWISGLPWIDVSDAGDEAAASAAHEQGREDLAAILYTSGSTGVPKGVALSHRATHSFVAWAAERFDIGSRDRIASVAPFFFDLSLFDLFASLARGACVDFVPAGLTMAPARFSAWLATRGITVLYTVPSLLGFVARKGNLGATPLPHLRLVLFAGEVFPTPQLMELVRQIPNSEFYNLYGPTETNVCCYWRVEKNALAPEQPIPIGVPACGAELAIEDDGELCVRGPTMFSGYLQHGRVEPAQDRDGWYRSGDRVSVNAKGELLYHGRLDRMLKCSGYRVEPAEIEASIVAFDGVTACAVVGIDDPSAGKRPAAAIVAQNLDMTRLSESLRKRLPAYMWPCRMKVLMDLPHLPNGKVDYGAIGRLLQDEGV